MTTLGSIMYASMRSALIVAICSLSSWAAHAGQAPSASSPSASIAAPHAIEIPPGDLAAAIQLLVKQTGADLVYRPEQVAGLKTPGIKGTLTTEEAIGKLLEGTALRLSTNAAGAMLIAEPKPSARVPAQDSVRLAQAASASGQSQAPSDADPSAADPALDEIVVVGKGYGAPETKSNIALRQFPNTATIVDQERIQRQNLVTLQDVGRHTLGITGVSNASSGQFISRGFVIDKYLIDGVPEMSAILGTTTQDIFRYDRVEVLRGPAGLFSGAGSPAGAINLVRKRPLEERRVSTELNLGSWKHYRGELDVSVPVSDAIGFRGGVAYQDQDQFYDFGFENRLTGYVVSDFELAERTTLTIGADYDRLKVAENFGLPGLVGGGFADFRYSTFAGAAWNRVRGASSSAFLELQQGLGERWHLRANVRHSKFDRDGHYAYPGFVPVTPTDGVVPLADFAGASKQDSTEIDVHAVGSVSLFGRNHEILFGVDFARGSNDQRSRFLYGVDSLDLYDPDYDFPETPLTPDVSIEDDIKQHGVYGQARFRVSNGLMLVLGGRVSNYDLENVFTFLGSPPSIGRTELSGQFVPYGGVVWDFLPQWTAYASYAETFAPQAARTADGELIEPAIGKQIEAGVKGSPWSDAWLVSLALYQIEEVNRAQLVPPQEAQIFVASGRVVSEGVELEANGELKPGWQLNGGYAYNTNKYEEDLLFNGQPFTRVSPKHQIKVDTQYQPGGGMLHRFSIGGGVVWFSETTGGILDADGIDGRVTQGAYTVVDLRLGYQVSDHLKLSAQVNNLFDDDYFATIGNIYGDNFFGARRNFLFTARMAF